MQLWRAIIAGPLCHEAYAHGACNYSGLLNGRQRLLCWRKAHVDPLLGRRRVCVRFFLCAGLARLWVRRHPLEGPQGQLRKEEHNDEILQFVTYWEQRTGRVPQELLCDSKLTTYSRVSSAAARGAVGELSGQADDGTGLPAACSLQPCSARAHQWCTRAPSTETSSTGTMLGTLQHIPAL